MIKRIVPRLGEKKVTNSAVLNADFRSEKITINFIDPGTGGTGGATYNTTTYKVDNSNIKRTTIETYSINKSDYIDTNPQFSIYSETSSGEIEFLGGWDEPSIKGIAVGFKSIEGMTPLPLYEDLGLASDYIEKFELDLSLYNPGDIIDIECHMLRLDYYSEKASLHSMLEDHPDGDLSDIVIGYPKTTYLGVL